MGVYSVYRSTLNTIRSPRLRDYSLYRRVVFGIIGAVRGILSYYRHRKDKGCYCLISPYVNWFIVREITGLKETK